MRTLLLSIIILSFLFTQQLDAQIMSWEKVNDEQIPDSISLYAGTQKSGQAIKAWYVSIPKNHPTHTLVPIMAKGAQPVRTVSRESGAIFAINGGFFGGSSSVSTVVNDRNVLAKNVTALNRSVSLPIIRSAVSWDTTGSVSIEYVYHFGDTIDDFYKFDAPLDYANNATTPINVTKNHANARVFSDIKHALGGGPVLVKNSTRSITYDEEVFWGSGVGLSNKDPRTALGIMEDGTVILFVVDGRQSTSFGMSLIEMADELISLGCVEAINLDGGSSTQMIFNGELVNRPLGSASVVSVLALLPNDSLNTTPPTSENIIIDTENGAGFPADSVWFATANSGFWGETRSLLHPTQPTSGDAYFRYPLNTLTPGRYTVEGWWVPSSNRSTAAPYHIFHQDGESVVRVNQVNNGGVWNTLGTYNFSPTDSVIIRANTGESGRFVVADGIRFTRVQNTSLAEDNTLPKTTKLQAVYPNPFNPTTNFQIELASATNVDLTIYNMLGQQVMSASYGRLQAGSYIRPLTMASMPNGLYIAQMSFRNTEGFFRETVKITLLK